MLGLEFVLIAAVILAGFAAKDRVFATDIAALHGIITDQSLVLAANEAAAQHQLNLNGLYNDQFGLY